MIKTDLCDPHSLHARYSGIHSNTDPCGPHSPLYVLSYTHNGQASVTSLSKDDGVAVTSGRHRSSPCICYVSGLGLYISPGPCAAQIKTAYGITDSSLRSCWIFRSLQSYLWCRRAAMINGYCTRTPVTWLHRRWNQDISPDNVAITLDCIVELRWRDIEKRAFLQ